MDNWEIKFELRRSKIKVMVMVVEWLCDQNDPRPSYNLHILENTFHQWECVILEVFVCLSVTYLSFTHSCNAVKSSYFIGQLMLVYTCERWSNFEIRRSRSL